MSTFQNAGPVVNAATIEGNVTNLTNIYNNDSNQHSNPDGIVFEVQVPEHNFTGRSYELDQLQELLSTNAERVVVSGMGGVGKTQLVRKFIERNKSQYANCIWIHSESIETMEKSFRILSKDILGLTTLDANGKEMESKSVISKVLRILYKLKTLLVYDNVDSIHLLMKSILAFTPPRHGEKPHILITSRIQYWPKELKVINLKVWDMTQSVEYISKVLNSSRDDPRDEKEMLAEMLQFFPLALKQATAYINQQRRRRSEFKISQYIDEFARRTRTLLNYDKFREESLTEYDKTTYTTWGITVDAIRRDEFDGVLAIRILNISAYMEIDQILIHRFKRLKFNDENQQIDHENQQIDDEDREARVVAALDLLVKFCMVNYEFSQKYFSVHRLVKRVTKLLLKDSNQEESVIRDALQLYNDNSESYFHSNEVIPIYRDVFTLSNSAKEKLIREFSSLLFNIFDRFKGSAYVTEFESFILDSLTTFLLPNDRTVLKVKYFIAVSNGLYKFNTIEMLNDICDKQTFFLGESDPDTLDTQRTIISRLLKLKHFNKASKFSLSVNRKCSGESDTIFKDMEKLSLNYGAFRNDHSQLNLYLMVISENESIALTITSIFLAHEYNGNYELAIKWYKELAEFIYKDTYEQFARCTFESFFSDFYVQLRFAQFDYVKQRNFLGEVDFYPFRILKNIADAHLELRNYALALQLYQYILEKQKIYFREKAYEIFRIMYKIAYIHSQLGDKDSALQWFQKAFESGIYSNSLEHESILKYLADTIINETDYSLTSAFIDRENAFAQIINSNTISLMYRIANCLFAKKNYECAHQWYQRVLESQETCVPPRGTFKIMCNIAHVQSKLQDNNLALQWYRKAFEGRMTGVHEEDRVTIKKIYNIASNQIERGNNDLALKLYEYILEKLKLLLGEHHIDTLEAMANIAHLKNNYSELQVYQNILEKQRNISLGEDDLDTLKIICEIAIVHTKMKNYNLALDSCKVILEKQNTCFGENHRNTLKTMCDIAGLHFEMNNLELALHSYKIIFEKQKNHFGEDDNDTLKTMCNIARTYARLQDNNAALQWYQAPVEKVAQTIRRNKFNSYKEDEIEHEEEREDKVVELELGYEYFFILKKEKAKDKEDDDDKIDSVLLLDEAEWLFPDLKLQLYEIIFEKRESYFGKTHDATIKTLCKIARVYGKLQNNSLALQWYQKIPIHPKKLTIVIAKSEASFHVSEGNSELALHLYEFILERENIYYDDDNKYSLETMCEIARTHIKLRNNTSALKSLSEVLEKRKSTLGEFHPDTLETMFELASLNENMGNQTDALQLYQNLFEIQKFLKGKRHVNTLKTESKIASLLDKLGQGNFEQRNAELKDRLRNCFTAHFPFLWQHKRKLSETPSLEAGGFENNRFEK